MLEAKTDTILGSSFTPANITNPNSKDIENFFNLAAQIGSHITLITDWKNEMPVKDIENIMNIARAYGLKFHLYLNPIALYGGRKTPAIPANIGENSFSNPKVREAFKAKMLQLAGLRPDYLGLGTEVNFLAQNPAEFKQYLTLTQETYKLIKKRFPFQTVTISFQWDIMITQKQFGPLILFARSLDVYSFTTYPGFFKDADNLPAEYYSCIRKLLPAQRIGFSEVGWNSAHGSSEEAQAKYYSMLAQFMRGIKLEFLTLSLMHDVNVFDSELSALNSVGVRNMDGTPKKSWNAVLNLKFD